MLLVTPVLFLLDRSCSGLSGHVQSWLDCHLSPGHVSFLAPVMTEKLCPRFAPVTLQSFAVHCSCCRHWPLASVGAVVMLVVWEAAEDSPPLSATLWPAHIAFRVWKTAWGATFIFNRSTMILGGNKRKWKNVRSRFPPVFTPYALQSCFCKCGRRTEMFFLKYSTTSKSTEIEKHKEKHY